MDEAEKARAVCLKVKELGGLTEELEGELRSLFGERFEKALRTVEERRVKRYVFQPSGRVVWIVVGEGDEYRILPHAMFCSCEDFYFRVVGGERGLCYHLLAWMLAEALGVFDVVEESDELYEDLMEEWRKTPK